MIQRLFISLFLFLLFVGGNSFVSAQGGLESGGNSGAIVEAPKNKNSSSKKEENKSLTIDRTNEQGTVRTQFKHDPPVVYGIGANKGSELASSELTKTGISLNTDIKGTLLGWTRLLLPIAAILAVIAIVWAGTLYIVSFGDDGKRETAKNIILWVIVGIALILGSYAIVKLFMEARF